MESEFAPNARRLAEAFFASGYYCAESVVMAIAKSYGIESALLPGIATAFCGGVSRTCGPCGALSGAIMGVGLVLGRSRPDDSEEESYAVTQQLVRAFEQAFGARNCNELLGCDLGTPEGQAAFQADRMYERCNRYTGIAAEIAARLINQWSIDVQPLSSLEELTELLALCDLPTAEISLSQPFQFFGIRVGGALGAAVGLELYPPVGLLRSLAVRPALRKHGFANALVAHAESFAAARGVERLFLLTTTAGDFFAKRGYAPTSRIEAPPVIQATSEFAGLCPSSSAFLSRTLGPVNTNPIGSVASERAPTQARGEKFGRFK